MSRTLLSPGMVQPEVVDDVVDQDYPFGGSGVEKLPLIRQSLGVIA
jgi:hypothetical protein